MSKFFHQNLTPFLIQDSRKVPVQNYLNIGNKGEGIRPQKSDP